MTMTLRAIVAVMTLAGSLALAGGAFAQAAPKPSQAQAQADKACQAHAKGSLQHQQCVRQHLAKSKKAASNKNKPPMTMKKTEQKA
jgi:hypothetical protein